MRKHEKNYDKEDDFVVVDPLDMSDEEVQSNDEKKSNSKGKVNDKDESSQATPKGQSSQAKAPRPKFGTWTAAEGSKSKGKRRVGVMEIQSDVHNHDDLGETQTDLHDDLVNFDNENGYGYESEKYSDAEDEDGTNSSDHKLVKRGITRLCKFRMTYAKLGSVKLKVTFDVWNRVSGLHRALFSSFLGDLVREHIGLKILCWKKVKKESRDKLWDEITRYFDVDSTPKGLVMHRLGQLLRNFKMKLREKYILPNLDTPLKLNELPKNYSAIVNTEEWAAFVNYTATDAYKEKSAKGLTLHVYAFDVY
ncbi:hypothetical protein Tco_1252902 [Tanacetum coccineum]